MNQCVLTRALLCAIKHAKELNGGIATAGDGVALGDCRARGEDKRQERLKPTLIISNPQFTYNFLVSPIQVLTGLTTSTLYAFPTE